jgi:hypothetical protein
MASALGQTIGDPLQIAKVTAVLIGGITIAGLIRAMADQI